MPIIARVGRTAWSTRLLVAGMYLVLIAGALTMLYPFLLMIATSLAGETDYEEFRLLPRYFTDDEARFQKYLHERYQVVSDYNANHADAATAFRNVDLPLDGGGSGDARRDPVTHAELPPRRVLGKTYEQLRRRVELWRQFASTLSPREYSLWFVGRRSMPGKAEMLWRQFLEKTCGDVGAAAVALGRPVQSFAEVFAPYDAPGGRLWAGVAGEEGRLWEQFKSSTDARYRRPVDGTLLWRKYLAAKYERIADLNRAWGTDAAGFHVLAAPVVRPADERVASDWEHWVRNEVPFRFVVVPDGGRLYRDFLLRDTTLADANRRYGTAYAGPDAMVWPPQDPSPLELAVISAFLREVSAADLRVRTPDVAYREFLARQFGGSIDRANAELGTTYTSFDDVRPPYVEEDVQTFHEDDDSWFSWSLTRNYGEVIDYIAVRGRSLWNTVFLVAVMIAAALTVNPLAAYALSRFRLPYANQVLLLLLATMAFPYEVTMIPNFLLLRQFPLWTWLIGLVVGLLAGVAVFRGTRGVARYLGWPLGIGAGLFAGLYVTPLIGQMLGIDLGPVSLLNTFPALILPRLASGFGIFLLKGFFDSLPEELFEAARIDGASEMRMLWQVAFPLSTPILAVLALQTFTAVYGSYLWALVVCQDDRMWTLMVHVFQLQQWAPAYVTMAAAVLTSIPTLLVFVLAQNVIMRGVILPAYK